MENMRKHRDIKFVTTKEIMNYLASEPTYHTTENFSENLFATEMKKTPVYLGLLVLEISKIVMYYFWHDQAKPKYGEKSNLWYMDTTNFIVCIKTEDIYSDISKDVKKRFDTSNYKLDRPLPKGKNKKVTGLIKDELDDERICCIKCKKTQQ